MQPFLSKYHDLVHVDGHYLGSLGVVLGLVPREEAQVLPVEAGGGVAHVLVRLAARHAPRQLLQRPELGLVPLPLPLALALFVLLLAPLALLRRLRVRLRLRVVSFGELFRDVRLEGLIVFTISFQE